MASKKVACLEITGPTHVWNRCFHADFVPSEEDFVYYYNTLLGLDAVSVSLTVESIPDDFNMSLLPNEDGTPTAWPACDLQTELLEVEKREKFKQYVRHICETERMRASLRFMKSVATAAPAAGGAAEPKEFKPQSRQQAWFQELLKTLDGDGDADVERDALMAIHETDETRVPIAWVFTPCVADVRRRQGSRIIMDPALGTKWASVLGTPACPDLIVSRRISTVGWGFQGTQSDNLLRATVDWFIASQDAVVTDGLTPYLLGADKELARILFTFKRTRVNERFLTEDREDDADPLTRVYKLVKYVELHLLASALEDPSIPRIGYELFKKYLHYLFRNNGIPREYYETDPNVERILLRWVESHMGFRSDAEPPIAVWKTLWEIITHGEAVTPQRLSLFLTTLDSMDPLAMMLFTQSDKQNFATEWIKLYLETQTIPDIKERVKSVILQEQVKQWCAQYISETAFANQLMPGFIGPVCTRAGFYTKRFKAGRFTLGLKFKNIIGTDAGNEVAMAAAAEATAEEEAEEEVLEMEESAAAAGANVVKEINTIQFTSITQEEDGVKTRKRAVRQTVIAERENSRIEHFFAASTTTIDLGAV
jgi:hypothetical protein